MDVYGEASATAMALVRSAALGHRRGVPGRDPGQLTRDYLEKARRAQGVTDAAEPLALLTGALVQLAGAAVLAGLAGPGGQLPAEEEIAARLDDAELFFAAAGGFRRG
jgi:hypothetical protein